jgi:flagellum-specific peptidoglycan hydrolase FlgJ
MTEDQNDFMAMTVPAAQSSARLTGVPASITIAQAILESGWGKTALARDYNNFFGIKANQEQLADHDYCEFTAQEVVLHMLVKVPATGFAQYATPEESFAAHSQLLCRSHYAPAMACAGNPDKFAWALGPKIPGHPEGCDYSSLPQYHDRLMQLVHIYDLTQYDVPKRVDVNKAATAGGKA